MLETAYAGRCHALLSRIALTRLVSASDEVPEPGLVDSELAEQVRELGPGGGAIELGVDE